MSTESGRKSKSSKGKSDMIHTNSSTTICSNSINNCTVNTNTTTTTSTGPSTSTTSTNNSNLSTTTNNTSAINIHPSHHHSNSMSGLTNTKKFETISPRTSSFISKKKDRGGGEREGKVKEDEEKEDRDGLLPLSFLPASLVKKELISQTPKGESKAQTLRVRSTSASSLQTASSVFDQQHPTTIGVSPKDEKPISLVKAGIDAKISKGKKTKSVSTHHEKLLMPSSSSLKRTGKSKKSEDSKKENQGNSDQDSGKLSPSLPKNQPQPSPSSTTSNTNQEVHETVFFLDCVDSKMTSTPTTTSISTTMASTSSAPSTPSTPGNTVSVDEPGTNSSSESTTTSHVLMNVMSVPPLYRPDVGLIEDDDKRPKSARDKTLRLLTHYTKSRVKTARQGGGGDSSKKRIFSRSKERLEDEKFARFSATFSQIPVPASSSSCVSSLSPVKAREWSMMTIEKANELKLDTMQFLGELQDLLSEDKNAQILFMEAQGYIKLLNHLLTSDIHVAKKIVEIIADSIEEKEIFTHLFIDFPEVLIKITHLLLKFNDNGKMKTLVYQLLLSLVEVPQSLELTGFDGLATLLCALNYYKSKSTEQRRFEHLVTDLRSEIQSSEKREDKPQQKRRSVATTISGNYIDKSERSEDSEYAALALFKLINTLIDGNEDLEARIATRYEFTVLGLDELVDSIPMEKYKDSMLMYYIQSYKMSREGDNNQRQAKHTQYLMEKTDAEQITDEIMKRLQKQTHIQYIFVNILQNIVHLQVDDNSNNNSSNSNNNNSTGLPLWLLLDKITSEICNDKNDLTKMITKGKITLDNFDLKKVFVARSNEEKLQKELLQLNEEYKQNKVLLMKAIEQLEAKVLQKKEKISFIRQDYEEEIEQLLEENRQHNREIDTLLDEYDDIIQECEIKLQKSDEENSKIKNLLEQKTMQIEMLMEKYNLSNITVPTEDETKSRFRRRSSDFYQHDVSTKSHHHQDESSTLPKWKLQQQQQAKHMQEQRERERTAKILKVNSIRKRIKEIGHDAVTNGLIPTEEDEKAASAAAAVAAVAVAPAAAPGVVLAAKNEEENPIASASANPNATTATATTDAAATATQAKQFHLAKQSLQKMAILRHRSVGHPRSSPSSSQQFTKLSTEQDLPIFVVQSPISLPQPSPRLLSPKSASSAGVLSSASGGGSGTPVQREEDLSLKLEKVKSKKKNLSERLTKLEKELQQQKLQLLALEKEKEARQREDKKIEIKMKRLEEEKETVQRQRQTLQEEMKKLAQQREKITQEHRKEKEKIAKTRQTLENDQKTFTAEQQQIRDDIKQQMDLLAMERAMFEEELMAEYMEEKELQKNNNENTIATNGNT